MDNQSLVLAFQRSLIEKGFPGTIQTVALLIKNHHAVEKATLKIDNEDITFQMNGKVYFCLKNQLEERPRPGSAKVHKLLDSLQSGNIKRILDRDIFNFSFFSTNESQSTVSAAAMHLASKINAAVKVEHLINASKKVGTVTSVIKQFYMLVLFDIYNSVSGNKDKLILQKEISLSLGLSTTESKRALSERFRKVQCLGELASHFGRDIVFIPKLGIRTYFLMNQSEKAMVRDNRVNLGSHLFASLKNTLLSNPETSAIMDQVFRGPRLPSAFIESNHSSSNPLIEQLSTCGESSGNERNVTDQNVEDPPEAVGRSSNPFENSSLNLQEQISIENIRGDTQNTNAEEKITSEEQRSQTKTSEEQRSQTKASEQQRSQTKTSSKYLEMEDFSEESIESDFTDTSESDEPDDIQEDSRKRSKYIDDEAEDEYSDEQFSSSESEKKPQTVSAKKRTLKKPGSLPQQVAIVIQSPRKSESSQSNSKLNQTTAVTGNKDFVAKIKRKFGNL